VTAAPYRFLPPELADRLRGLGLSVRKPVEGGRQGLHRSPHHGSSVEFADYREYTAGDPPNRIDWAVYARTDRYVIRRYQEETNLRAYILLDTSQSMAFGELGLYTKMDYASYLAAGLMFVLVNQSDAVGLTLFGETVGKSFPPTGSLDGLRPMLLALQEIKPTGRSRIHAALHRLAEQVRRRSLIILISDLLEDPAQLVRGLQHLHHNRHEIMVLQPLDAAELSLNFGGLSELRDLETGERMPVQADEIRDAYAQEIRTFLEEIRRGCLDCLADYHLVDTRAPLEETFHARFGGQL
jgi:uncharacterized protein (DUF58 family)